MDNASFELPRATEFLTHRMSHLRIPSIEKYRGLFVDSNVPMFHAILGIVDQVLSVDLAAAERAKSIVLGSARLSARNALHLAVMEQHSVSRILSFDAGFDGHPGIARLC